MPQGRGRGRGRAKERGMSQERQESTQTMPQGRGKGRSAKGRGMPQENENTSNGREMPHQNQVNEGMNRGRCRGIGMPQKNHENEGTSGGQSSRPFKRSRMVGFGVLIGDDGFTTVNPGMQSRRVVDIGTRVPRRSDEVTGDIGYQPHFGVKWKGKSAITSNRLQQIRVEKRIQTRSATAAINESQSNSTTKR
ncbi:hypothetical protein MTR67_036869 [Solanum verrucosum]|uniref:Uncharacterized protein n=1 Tax=Solanum verrucosum TaxID=315347 RepID=A0AAF0UDI6_SOLVR|nr:hypothetical protein MTR67_036869 [Solanum verrucosum]